LNAGDEVGFDDTIDQKGLVSLAEAALAETMRADLPKSPDVGSIFARLNALNEERRALEAKQQGSVKEADVKRGEAERYRAEANLGEIDITQGRIRVCPICRVSVDEARAKGCGISLERCDLAALQATIADKLVKAAQLAGESDNAAQEAKKVGALINQIGPRQQALQAEAQSADEVSRAAQAVARAGTDEGGCGALHLQPRSSVEQGTFKGGLGRIEHPAETPQADRLAQPEGTQDER
jgi:hypothetical protein